jgi:hypothetical protein
MNVHKPEYRRSAIIDVSLKMREEIPDKKKEDMMMTMRKKQTPNLKRLESYDHISNHHVKFMKKNLPLVVERLYDVFRIASIQVVRINDQPTFSIHCCSIDRVSFVVTLWEDNRKRTKDTNRIQSVILEVNQSSGDRFNFHRRYAKYVLQAADVSFDLNRISDEKGYSNPALQKNCQKLRCNIPFHLHSTTSNDELIHKDTNNHIFIDDDELAFQAATEIAFDLLKTDRYDAQILGLESFKSLSDCTKLNDHADIVARGILLGVGTGQDWKRIHERICTLAFTFPTMEHGDCTFVSDGAKCEQFEEDQYFLAITIISQSIALLKSDEKVMFVKELDRFLLTFSTAIYRRWSSIIDESSLLIQLLSHCLDAATENPHVAYHAAKIISSLVSCNDSWIQSSIQRHNASIIRAHDCGAFCHLALEQVSAKVLLSTQELHPV